MFISSTLCYPNKKALADLNNLISAESCEAFTVHIKLVALYRHTHLHALASALSVWVFIPARELSKARIKEGLIEINFGKFVLCLILLNFHQNIPSSLES